MHRRVIKDWKQSYNPALKVARGDLVFAIKRDHSKWTGWIWCTDKSGLAGWLPELVFKTVAVGKENIILQDFDTLELTVSIGEIVFITRHLNEWTWCRNAVDQEGWVPDICLGPEPSDAS